VCTSTDPRDNRLRQGAAIEFVDAGGQARTVLIDATPDLRQQALRHGLSRCDAILFTHNHVDHTFGLDEVRRFNVLQNGPVAVYAEERTLAFLRRVYQHVFDADRNVNDSFVARVIATPIEPEQELSIFGLRVRPVRLLHGRLPVLGFVVWPPPHVRWHPRHSSWPLAYCTDVSAIPPETWPHLDGLGTLVLDALRERHHPTHFTLDQAQGVAERTGARRAWFIHIAHDLSHHATNARLPAHTQLAHDGLVISDD
jgi:phosphoribosyl 1,2-cyclic phosphate phosphodiesterase